MEETKHIKISDYNYPLPDERIAKFPLPVRDQSKLLVYQHGQISETHFIEVRLVDEQQQLIAVLTSSGYRKSEELNIDELE